MRAARVWLLASVLALAASCYPARGGFWPPVDRMAALRPGVSSQAEVEALLGSPLGRGIARMTPEMTPRELWVYSYMDFSGRKLEIDQGQLLVFFEGGRYDGHFWGTTGTPPEPSTGPRQR